MAEANITNDTNRYIDELSKSGHACPGCGKQTTAKLCPACTLSGVFEKAHDDKFLNSVGIKEATMNNNKEAADKAILRVIANVKQKFAELDALDEQFADLDDTAPMDMDMGMVDSGVGEQFNLLSDKREELEQEIRSMRERVQLISEWEKFKGSGWGDEIQSELNSLDQQFANIADGASSEPLGMPPLPSTPLAPEVPGVPPLPPTPEIPADATAGEPPIAASEPPIEEPAPPAEPLAAPMASTKNTKINEKTNYELQDKKGSKNPSDLKKGDTHMANQPTKPSLKEKLAEAKNKREAITKEAKTRVASAWTIAKTMLPTAPDNIKKAFAASLLTNSTKALKAALRQTAINAHCTKLAETFKEVHKTTLNEFLEEPSVLKAEKSAVEKELKGDVKSAGKVADDRKESGPQPKEYNDGRDGSEPKEIDASKAGERPDAGEKPGQTQNLSDGKTEKAATKKKAEFPPAKGAPAPDATPDAPSAEEEAPVDAPPAEEAPAELPPPVEGNPEAEATEILTDEKKQVLEEKINEAQAAIQAIESEILEEGDEELDLAKLEEGEQGIEGLEGLDDMEGEVAPEGEQELDFSQVFNEDNLEDKAASLANEGDEKQAGEEDDFFAPSAASSLEASLDDDGMADMHSMFSLQGADGDPLAALIAGLKTAEQVAGIEVLPSMTGELANHFEQDEVSSEDRDTESDHSDTLWAETIKGISSEEQGAKRTPQDAVPQLEKPKAAVLKKIRTASGSDKAPKPFDVGKAFWPDED